MPENKGTASWFCSISSTIFARHREASIERAEGYRKQFAQATDEKTSFKYLLLMDLECLETYITQTYLQAGHSFVLCVIIGIFGSVLLLIALGVGIWSQIGMNANMHALDVAYLSGIAGIITQLISGVFFYFYHMTLRQFNLFHTQLESSRKICLSLYLQSLMTGADTEQDQAKLELIKVLVATEQPRLSQQNSGKKQTKKPQAAGAIPLTAATHP